uniref:Uncharacterized protein n=1 Tax=Tanacetum cinerariifolium TaxID=118510 RepID=A0A699I205_TANCI|nr:hypothetical protein [Tanacetum cinerariifolium]
MDDPNITMEEYIMLEEEKAYRHSKAALSREPTISPLNDDEIDFRISFDEYDDEHYTGKPLILMIKNLYVPFGEIGLQERIRRIRNHRHPYLRFKGLEYTDANITHFEERLARIYDREIHQVHVFDFGGLTDLMTEGLSGRMPMEHRDAQGQIVFTSQAWRWLFEVRGPLLHKLILEFFSTFRFGEAEIESVRFDAYWAKSARQVPDKEPRDERQQVDAAGAPEVAEDAPAVYEGALAILAPVQVPQPVTGPSRSMAQRIARLEEDVHRMRGALGEQREVLDSIACDISRFTTRMITSLSRMMDQAGVRYTSYTDF